jgi:ubiquinone biosynthesis protein COQ9
MGLVEMRQHFSTKGEVLAAFVRAVDDAMLTALPEVGVDDLKRDQLFEIVMARFDALAPYKAALKSISADSSADMALIKALAASQAWMLEAAGIGSGGIDGGVRVAGLATVYASVYRTWLHDDDPGQARTMAVLDRRLRRGERTLATVEGVARKVRDVGGRVVSMFGRVASAPSRSSDAKDGSADDASGSGGGQEMPRQV